MKQTIMLALLCLFLNSCMSIAWIGYEAPEPSDYRTLGSAPVKLGMQNLTNEDYNKAVSEAFIETFIIFDDPKFQQQVESKDWLISCKRVNDQPDILDGKKVYTTLKNGFIDFSIHPRRPWNAIAQAHKSKQRVAIKPKRIKTWFSNDIKTKALLINTIAHEITHLVSYDFSDRGHGTPLCPDDELVSYGIGNLVAQLWIEKQ